MTGLHRVTLGLVILGFQALALEPARSAGLGSTYVMEVEARKQAKMALFLSKYASQDPPNCWFQAAFLLSALELNRSAEIARGAEMLRTIFRDPGYYANELINVELVDGNSSQCYWAQPSLLRIFLHPNAKNLLALPLDPAQPEKATIRGGMLAGFRKVVAIYSTKNDSTDPLVIQSSENHMFNRRASLLIMLEALIQDEQEKLASGELKAPKLINGKPLAEHYEIWRNFWRRFLAAAAFNGTQTEVASPIYTKYTVTALMLMADHATSHIERSNAQQFLNLMFSDMAQEFFGETGVRGGASTRTYKDYSGLVSGMSEMTNIAYTYGWTGVTTSHASVQLIPLVASKYIPPTQLRKLVLERSRRLPPADPLLELQSRRPAAISTTYAWDGSNRNVARNRMSKRSPLLRQTSVGRNFILGTMYLPPADKGKSLRFSNVSTQNLRMGITFNSSVHSQITVIGEGNDGTSGSVFGGDRKGYHEINGVSARRAAVIWLDPRRESNNGLMVFLSHDGGLWGNSTAAQGIVRPDGWIFTQAASGEYVAINVSGGFDTRDVVSNGISYGTVLLPRQDKLPVVIQVAEKEWFASMKAFQRAVLALPLQRKGQAVAYTSMGAGGKKGAVIDADSNSQLAFINAHAVRNSDDIVFAGRNLQGDLRQKKFQIRYASAVEVEQTFAYPLDRCEIQKPSICPNSEADPYAGLSLAVTPKARSGACMKYASKFAQICGVAGQGLINTRWLKKGIPQSSATN